MAGVTCLQSMLLHQVVREVEIERVRESERERERERMREREREKERERQRLSHIAKPGHYITKIAYHGTHCLLSINLAKIHFHTHKHTHIMSIFSVHT